MFQDKMVTPAIPERDATHLCGIAAEGTITEALKRKSTVYHESEHLYFADYRTAATEHIIAVGQHRITVEAGGDRFDRSMRLYVNSRLEIRSGNIR